MKEPEHYPIYHRITLRCPFCQTEATAQGHEFDKLEAFRMSFEENHHDCLVALREREEEMKEKAGSEMSKLGDLLRIAISRTPIIGLGKPTIEDIERRIAFDDQIINSIGNPVQDIAKSHRKELVSMLEEMKRRGKEAKGHKDAYGKTDFEIGNIVKHGGTGPEYKVTDVDHPVWLIVERGDGEGKLFERLKMKRYETLFIRRSGKEKKTTEYCQKDLEPVVGRVVLVDIGEGTLPYLILGFQRPGQDRNRHGPSYPRETQSGWLLNLQVYGDTRDEAITTEDAGIVLERGAIIKHPKPYGEDHNGPE